MDNTKQTIAESIKHMSADTFERLAVTIDQDWANETTVYFFKDRSAIVCCGPSIEVL